MNYVDPPFLITCLRDLLPFSVPSDRHRHIVAEISLEKVSLDKTIDHILSLLNNGISVSHLNLTNCRLGGRFGELMECLSQKCVGGIHLNLSQSVRNEKDLAVLTSSKSLKIKSLVLSSLARLGLSNALVYYYNSNIVASLTLNQSNISLDGATAIYEWLQTKNSSLTYLSLASCGLGTRNGEALHVILSGLVGNRSIEGLNLSGNTFTGEDTLEACLGVLECPSLKSLWLDNCKIEAQVTQCQEFHELNELKYGHDLFLRWHSF